jgi:thiol-disulfide isomerase/thioredoxin
LPEKLRGQVVLVDFWASWCAPCKASFPAMEALQQKNGERGLVVLAINVDESDATMQKFLKKSPVSFAVVRDAKHKLVAAADVATMPTSFLVDRAGKVRFVHTGFRGAATQKEYEKEIDPLLKESAGATQP